MFFQFEVLFISVLFEGHLGKGLETRCSVVRGGSACLLHTLLENTIIRRITHQKHAIQIHKIHNSIYKGCRINLRFKSICHFVKSPIFFSGRVTKIYLAEDVSFCSGEAAGINVFC